ncbi:MAG TPA: FumA C-terminus/TtdB family hydratase beta subunit [Thermoplasmata archaeon]|nr:FumA C-terminus/TtdB family hydratase beta subunit [Thermoplasmata archaeon]
MSDRIELRPPLKDADVATLSIGDPVTITGLLYGARDAAHKKMVDLLDAGRPLPVDLRGHIVYYVGPTPAPPGRPIGAAGPTTSLRMDAYAPRMYEYGVKATVGKGNRNQAVIDSLVRHRAVYLIAVGGLGATLSQRIKSAKVIAYPELGTEALWEFRVEDFPAIVANDTKGRDVFKEGQEVWAKKLAVA